MKKITNFLIIFLIFNKIFLKIDDKCILEPIFMKMPARTQDDSPGVKTKYGEAFFKTYKRYIPRVEHLTVTLRDVPILSGVYLVLPHTAQNIAQNNSRQTPSELLLILLTFVFKKKQKQKTKWGPHATTLTYEALTS